VSATQDPTGVRRNVERGPLGEVVAVHDGGEDLEARCDRLGRVVSVTGPDGTEQTVRYDRCGRVVEAVDATGAVTRYERDAAGRAVAVTQPTGGRLPLRVRPVRPVVGDRIHRRGPLRDPLRRRLAPGRRDLARRRPGVHPL